MSCFGNRVSPDLYDNCCNGAALCRFEGNLDDVVSEPIYVQKVFDAVLFNLQGMKTVQNQKFTPNIPRGHRVVKVVDIRCKKFFNPCNVNDAKNLKLDVNTTISGASFLKNSTGDPVMAVGPDGSFSEKILYAETAECDGKCKGTPVFGTQNICVTGNVTIFLDLLLCDRCNNEVVFTVCADVNIAHAAQPMLLTNFFEICMPSTSEGAFYPRFTEFANAACETRLATNNCGRDLTVCSDGEVRGNLIIALCISCEKKVVVPVQLCVLSTGFVEMTPNTDPICTTFPALFPSGIRAEDTEENCGSCDSDAGCDPCNTCDPCDPCESDDACNPCNPCESSSPRQVPAGDNCGCGCDDSRSSRGHMRR